jgi:hypothetical protein
MVDEEGKIHENVPLAPEVAQRCYGTPDQSVKLRWRRLPDPNASGKFIGQLEVSPPPAQDALTVEVTLADGIERTLIVKKPRVRRENATAQVGGLSADAFGKDDWVISVELKGVLGQPNGGLAGTPRPYGVAEIGELQFSKSLSHAVESSESFAALSLSSPSFVRSYSRLLPSLAILFAGWTTNRRGGDCRRVRNPFPPVLPAATQGGKGFLALRSGVDLHR